MSEKPKMKQIGGIFVEDEIYQKFIKITPMLDYKKPTDLLVETIRTTVEKNAKLLEEEYLSEDELIQRLEEIELPRSRSTIHLMRKSGEIPAECYVGGEKSRRIFYNAKKTIEKIQENKNGKKD